MLAPLVTPALYVGVLYLCVLPATVQSAIALPAGAAQHPGRGVQRLCPTLLGVFVTPLLVNLVVVPHHMGRRPG